MVNRNRGSGTRVLIDQLLGGIKPNGYLSEVKSHTAVAASICQNRSDWGIAIQAAVKDSLLNFIPITEEKFDFVIPKPRIERPEIKAFLGLLKKPEILQKLSQFGLKIIR